MRIPRLTRSVDQRFRATVTVQFRVELQQLAQFFWDGSPSTETCVDDRPEVPVSVVHARVLSSIRRQGEDFFIEDDVFWDHGGKEWAESQVRRAYREEA